MSADPLSSPYRLAVFLIGMGYSPAECLSTVASEFPEVDWREEYNAQQLTRLGPRPNSKSSCGLRRKRRWALSTTYVSSATADHLPPRARASPRRP